MWRLLPEFLNCAPGGSWEREVRIIVYTLQLRNNKSHWFINAQQCIPLQLGKNGLIALMLYNNMTIMPIIDLCE